MKKYLPIGSVVLLKNGNKRLMIVGLKQQQVGTDKVWDYSACLFPEGIIDPDQLYMFDNEQIDRLYFVGMQDSESLDFMNRISETDDGENA